MGDSLSFFTKMRGNGGKAPPRVSWTEIFWSLTGGFFGILLVAWLDRVMLHESDLFLMLGSFGASAVLLYGAPATPLAQPRNLLGGHFLSALTGVAIWRILPHQETIAAALAVSLAIALMQLTRTLHPPGGATALLAVIGSERLHALGFLYPFIPVAAGAILLLLVALLVNNLAPGRRYPVWWF